VFAGGVGLAAEHAGQLGNAAGAVFNASITRAISPDDAMARNGRAGSPGFGKNNAMMISHTLSVFAGSM